MTCIFGIDIVKGSLHGRRRPKYALYILKSKGSIEFKELSKAKLFRLVKIHSPEIIALDSISELFSSKEELISFLRKIPDIRLVQVAGRFSLPALAKRFGLKIDIRKPIDEAKACAILASYGVGEEVSVFSDKTTITISRNRSLGKGGWSQNRYRRKVHEEVRRVYMEIKEMLDEHGFDYDETIRRGFGGLSKGVITVNAPRKELPISSFKTGNVQVRVEAIEKEKIEYVPLSKQITHVIVGVDPGTTTAIAVLDLNGKLLGVRSKKGWNSAEVIEYILSFGKPVVVATDKSDPPDFVSKLKASFNATLHVPKDDMSVEKKKYLTSPFKHKISNDHERDALSAAIDAYNAHKSKLMNVEKRIPPGIDADTVKAGIIRGLTLRKLIEKTSCGKSDEKKEKDKPQKSTENVNKLKKILKELEEENKLLRNEVSTLREEVERLRSKMLSLSKEEHRKIRRENYIKSLENELSEVKRILKERDKTIEELRSRIELLKSMKMLEFSGWKSIKVLRKFTRDCIEELESAVGINDGDILYIQMPAGGGRTQAEYLCSKGIKAVISEPEKMAHTALSVFEEMDVPVIDENELELRIADGFAIVNTEKFNSIYSEKLKELKEKKIESIEKIIIEYKKRRET
jgi:predicted RNase H-like nuclease (RuvC/YqgF family)